MGAIEDITLDLMEGVAGGRPSPRQIDLRMFLPNNYLEDAAQFILDHPGRLMILTGFFIPVPYTNPLPDGGSVEFDGPIGAYGLGQSLKRLNYQVTYVSDKWCTMVYRDVPGAEDYVEFPITSWKESEEFADKLLADRNPSIVVATERCGATRNGRYLNMMRWDISEFTAKIDPILNKHPHTIGIGDGGNEMGMGNFIEFIEEVPHPMIEPTVTRCTLPLLGKSSDWGCHGVVTALSKLTKRDLLPTAEEEESFIRDIVDRGVVHGTGRKRYMVDSATLEETAAFLERLRGVLRKEGIATRE